MKISEKRKKWLSKRAFKRSVYLSFGLLIVAYLFQGAQIIITSELPHLQKILFSIVAVGILAIWIWIMGFLTPEFMEVAFRMLAFSEKEDETKKNTETKEKEKNEKRQSMSKYEKTAVLFTTLTLICSTVLTVFSLYLVVQTNRIHSESLQFQRELQGMMYNFTSYIAVRPDYAYLGKQSTILSHDNVTIQTIHLGYLDVILQVITPHCGKVNVRCKHFNVSESPKLDQDKKNQTTVYFASESDVYEHLVDSGLNQLSDHIRLEARVYINASSISPDTTWIQFPLGRLFLEAELFDIQTNSTLTREFSTAVMVEYEPPPTLPIP